MSNPGLDTPASHAVTPSADGVRRLWTAIQRWLYFPAVAAVLALAPVAGLSDFAQSLIIEIMIYAMLASSLNLLLGQTGLVSLGHAAFFAVGAYAAALCANALSTDVVATLASAVAAGLALALPVGWLSVRLSGFYFLMITFSFAQMVFVAAMRWTWLSGGSDGLIVAAPHFVRYACFAGTGVGLRVRPCWLHGESFPAVGAIPVVLRAGSDRHSG